MITSNSMLDSLPQNHITNPQTRPTRIVRFVAIVATLTAYLPCRAGVEIVKVGNPLWEPKGYLITSIDFPFTTNSSSNEDQQIHREAVLNGLGSPHALPDGPLSDGLTTSVMFPGDPHDGPYDNELRRAMAAQGGINTDVFEPQEMRNPNWLVFGGVLVPSENAPTGASPDSDLGLVIPNDVFPLTSRIRITFNGASPSCVGQGCRGRRIASLDSLGSFVDTDGEFHDVSNLNWSHIVTNRTMSWRDPNRSDSGILGNYIWREGLRDVNGNGWDVIQRFTIRRPTDVPGDLSYNGQLDMHDLNILTQNVAVGATNLRLDMNGDEQVNVGDVHHWVTDLKSTWIGDANLDDEFNSVDVVSVLQAGKFGNEQLARWNEGDWNGDERFDRADVLVALQDGGYGRGPRSGSTTGGNGGAHAAVGPSGSTGDDQTSILYDANSGELSVDAPAGVELTSINIDSAAGIFTGEASQNLGGSFDNDADGNIFKATFGSSFGSLSFGTVAQAGLSEEFVLGDLTVVGSLAGGGDLGNVDLVYVPEPTAGLLLAMGLAIGLLHFRRAGGRA